MKKSRYALPYEVWMVLFILVPILIVLYYACTTSQGGRVAFSLANLAQVFSPTYLAVLWRSLWIALVATVICLLIGYPVASILASRHFKRSSLMLMLIIIPMWMNFLLRTYAWINLLDTNGLIDRLLSLFGLGNVSLLYNTFAVIIGLVYNFLPFMVLPIYTILSKMEPQQGDDPIVPFSFMTDSRTLKNRAMCYLTYTTPETHRIILDNLDRAPM